MTDGPTGILSIALMFSDGQQIGRFERQRYASTVECQADADACNAKARAPSLMACGSSPSGCVRCGTYNEPSIEDGKLASFSGA